MGNSLIDITMPPIIDQIARTVMLSSPDSIKRLRFAVTAEEYADIRRYCLARDGRFHGRIRNCPLIVEEQPDDPPLFIETV